MSHAILYSFRRCPYAIRARLAIAYCGVECELREVVLKNKPVSMLEASPKGTVPVLIDGTKVIDESLEVMAWALEHADPDGWLEHSLEHPLITANDLQFKPKLDRYKYFDRYPEYAQSWYFDQALVFLQRLESAMIADSRGRYFLQSSKITTLDIAIFPFIRQFAFVDKVKFDSQNLPKLQSWLDYFLNYELFIKVMEKLPAWSPNQPRPILFAI